MSLAQSTRPIFIIDGIRIDGGRVELEPIFTTGGLACPSRVAATITPDRDRAASSNREGTTRPPRPLYGIGRRQLALV
jgi:hypothetical protein